MSSTDSHRLREKRCQGMFPYAMQAETANGASPKVYISSRTAKECEASSDELTQIGPGKCFAIPADMQKLSEVDRLVAELEQKEKVLHVTVNKHAKSAHDVSTDA